LPVIGHEHNKTAVILGMVRELVGGQLNVTLCTVPAGRLLQPGVFAVKRPMGTGYASAFASAVTEVS
jgi:hypothetical protein